MIHLTPFAPDHADAYRRWFADPDSSRYLEPPEDDWLAYILAGEEGTAWAALDEDGLAAVVQADWGDTREEAAISLCVDPLRRNRRIGRQVLCAWLADYGCAFGSVIAEIGIENRASLACFRSAGFVVVDPTPDAFGQILLRAAVPASPARPEG